MMRERRIKFLILAIVLVSTIVVVAVYLPQLERRNHQYNFILAWGSRGSGPGQFNGGVGSAALDSSGNVYVVDGTRIQEFTSSGSFITQWGSKDSGLGQFNRPTGVAVDSSGNVYVTDSGNYRVEKFGRVPVIPVEQVGLVIGIAVGVLAFIILKRPKNLRRRIMVRLRSQHHNSVM